MRQIRLPALQLGPRKTVRVGAQVKLQGGGTFGIRGRFTVRAILEQVRGKQTRHYLEGITEEHQWATVLVSGPAYRRFGVRWEPQKVSIPR